MAKKKLPIDANSHMPAGTNIGQPITTSDVELRSGQTPEFHDEAMATIVYRDYIEARNYLETYTWLENWQINDQLYQSPEYDRTPRMSGGRPERIPRFLVAKVTNTMASQVKRALFAEQVPFFLRPVGETTQKVVDAWTAILMALLKRMDFKYFVGQQIDCQTLQGTGIGRFGWQTKRMVKYGRKRKQPTPKTKMPVGPVVATPTKESDEFEETKETVEESWPFYEYRRLGTTLFDPKWSTPNRPQHSSGYQIDIDYVTMEDLDEMRKLTCYENIPPREVILDWLVNRAPAGGAEVQSQTAQNFTAQGSGATHAYGENQQTSADPTLKPFMLIERWTEAHVATILCYGSEKLLIRNEEHKLGRDCHTAVNWWSIDNSGYGMGTGRLAGGDQRINAGVLNECLKMIGYPMNAPILIAQGSNAPTQNVIQRMGGFMSVMMPPGINDVRRAMAFMEMPPVPPDAWRMLESSQQSGESITGANAPFMQGNLQAAGSTAARTATGANRIAGKADDSFADPVDNVAEGVIVPVIEWLIDMVKQRMPIAEIRMILKKDKAKIILQEIELDAFLASDLEVTVLAGQKLQAKQGIQHLVPFFMQLTQQPQILEYYHQIGKTVDFGVMLDLLMQVADLMQQPDIIRDLTPQEMESIKQMNPGLQKVQGATEVEQAKGAEKLKQITAQGQADIAKKAAEVAMERTQDGIPLERAEGLNERGMDERMLAQ